MAALGLMQAVVQLEYPKKDDWTVSAFKRIAWKGGDFLLAFYEFSLTDEQLTEEQQKMILERMDEIVLAIKYRISWTTDELPLNAKTKRERSGVQFFLRWMDSQPEEYRKKLEPFLNQGYLASWDRKMREWADCVDYLCTEWELDPHEIEILRKKSPYDWWAFVDEDSEESDEQSDDEN